MEKQIGFSEKKSPFADATAVWHMADLNDTAVKNSNLTPHGDVKLGIELKGAEREASIKRGGDGYVAEFHGGYFVAGSGSSECSRICKNSGLRLHSGLNDQKLSLTGKEMTFCIRMRDSSGKWNMPLFGRYDKDDPLNSILCGVDVDTKPFLLNSPYYLFAEEGEEQATRGSKALLEFQWRTEPLDCIIKRFKNRADDEDPIVNDARNGVLPLRVPVELIGPTDWHDVVVRFNGPNLEMFVDGVLADEDWPYGSLYKFTAPFVIGAGFSDGKLTEGFHGQIDHLALWNRALTDDEIAMLSGGKDEVAKREVEILGEEHPSLQYWRPRGYNTYAGDCMLLFHDDRLHLFWLFDRRHHSSKWHLGAHQYAHASTTDLIHWEHHPLAVPIIKQWECAMGTGDFIHHDGKFYAFYTDCGGRCQFPDKPHQGSGIFMSTSTDGIHFTKEPGPVVPGGDCTIFLDKTTGHFHLLTPGNTDDGQSGIIDYISIDLKNWTKQPELFHDTAGPCPHHFQWNDWYYFTVGGRFWKSHNPLGPWTLLRPERIDHQSLAYPKTAAFKDNRRIAAGWVGDGGWGGDLVFRELIQHEDGSLGTKFPPEMIPQSGEPLNLPFTALTEGASGNSKTFRLSSPEGRIETISVNAPDGFEVGMLTEVPRDVRITLQVRQESDSACFGLCVRGSGSYQEGCELRFEPTKQRVQFGNPDDGKMGRDSDYAIDHVEGLDCPFVLDIVMKDDIVDVCIDNRRTIIKRCPNLQGNRLFFFAQNSEVTFDSIEIRPLLDWEP